MSVSKSYEDSGLLSTVEDIAKDLLGFLVADVSFGAGLALVIAVSDEISKATDANFVGPGGLIGVVVAGGVVWTFGPSAIIAAVVAGVVAGAVTDAMIKHRRIRQDEYDFACEVFGDSLPPIEKGTVAGDEYITPGQVLIHELTHLADRQIQLRSRPRLPQSVGRVILRSRFCRW
jgi:hypothetical protein